MKTRYIRISTSNQSILRQLTKAHPEEKLYIDVCSGSIAFNERPEASKLLDDIKNGFVTDLRVSQIDRLGRNSFNVQETLNNLLEDNVNVHVDNLGICSIVNGKQNSIFKMITDVLANVAQMERESLLERQREGIASAIAKNPDLYKGRLKGTTESNEEVLSKYKSVIKIIKEYPVLSNNKVGALGNVSPHTVKKVKDILKNQTNLK